MGEVRIPLTSAASSITVVGDIDAESSTDGWVITSDGAGNSAWEVLPAGGGEINDLTAAVTWTNIPIANVPTGTTGSTVSLGNHAHAGVYEPVKGVDDNFVTDAEKIVIGNTSGANTGDQTIPVSTVDFDPVGTDNSDNNAINTLYSGLVTDSGEPATLRSGGTPTLASGVTAGEMQTLLVVDPAGTDNSDDNAVNTLYSGLVSNATHTGDVTGSTALTIAAGAVDVAMHSATGTPSATTFYRGDNTWAVPAGGVTPNPGVFEHSGSHDITTTESTIPFDTEVFDPDGNYSNASGEITVTAAGYYSVMVNVPINDDGTAGTTRGAVFGFLQKDAATSTWTTVNQIRGQVYEREVSQGTGFNAGGLVSLLANEVIRFRVDVSSTVDVSTESGQVALSIHKVRDA